MGLSKVNDLSGPFPYGEHWDWQTSVLARVSEMSHGITASLTVTHPSVLKNTLLLLSKALMG